MKMERAALRRVVCLLGGLFILLFLLMVRAAVLPFFLALILTYLVNPLVNILILRGFNRLWAVYFITICLLVTGGILLLYAVPTLAERLENLIGALPDIFARLEVVLLQWEASLERIMPSPRMGNFVSAFLAELEEMLIVFVEQSLEGLGFLLAQVVNLVLAPVLAYYILRDWELLGQAFASYFPPGQKQVILDLTKEMDRVVGGFLRGQFLASLVVGVLTVIGLMLLGVEFAPLLGIFAGITNLVPYFGPFLGAVPPVVITIFENPLKSLGVIALFVAIQQVESLYVSPRIFSHTMGLHPLAVIFALLAGGHLLGFLGLIVAVPLAGILRIFLRFVRPILALE